MSRYNSCFKKLANNKECAFVPFVTVADPCLELSLDIINTLIKNGADALELGLPFSDPVADGPTIQAANLRALNNKAKIADCFDLITKVRNENPDLPIGLLVYANIVFSNGIDNFYKAANDAGVDSVLIADVPVEESKPFVIAANKYNIDPIFIIAPNTPHNTMEKISKTGQGYTYLVSRSGVTGTQVKATIPLAQTIKTLEDLKAPPCILGFGISSQEQIKEAIKSGVAGVIVGSAIVDLIAKYQNDPKIMLKQIGDFTAKLKQATLPN